MIEAGEVGAVFRVVDDASVVLQRLARQFKELDGLVLKTKESMRLLGATGVGPLGERLGAINTKLTTIGSTSTEVTDVMASAFGRVDGSVNTTIDRIGVLRKELADTAAQSRALSGIGTGNLSMPRSQSGGGGVGSLPMLRSRGTGGAGGGGHGAGGGSLHAAPIPVVPGVHATLGHTPLAIGAMAAGASAYEAFKYAAELKHVQEEMKIAGVTPDKIAAATTLSYQLGQQFGQPVAPVLDTINEIRNPLGGIDPAMEHVKALGAAMVVLRGQDSKDGGNAASEIYDLVKSAEFRNAITPATFDKAIDAMVRADQATGGRVSPREFVQMSKMMKGALPGLSDEFLYTYAPELAQEFKGSSAGTSLASVYQNVIAGQIRTAGIRELEKLHEIDHTKLRPEDFDPHGRIVKVPPGANLLGPLMKNNPAEYAAAMIADMVKIGITDEQSQRDEFATIFGNRNAAQMMLTLGYQKMRLDRGAAGINQTMHTDDAAKELLANDPKATEQNLAAAYTNFLTAAGDVLVKPTTALMNSAAADLNAWRNIGDTTLGVIPGGGVDRVLQWRNRPYETTEGDAYAAFHALKGAGYPHGDAGAESARETSRGNAMMRAIPPPQVNTDVKVDVKAYLDSSAIAAKVETQITKNNRSVTGASDHDNAAAFAPPDMQGP